MRYNVFSRGNSSLLNINEIGFSGDSNVTRFGLGQRNFYIIHYVTKGKGYYNGNAVSAGQGFLIFPGQMEEYYPDEERPWEFLWIVSSDDNMEEIFERYGANPETSIFNYDFIPGVMKIAGEVISQNNSVLDSFKILEMFLNILNSHTYKNISNGIKSASEVYLDFAVNYIETNIYKQINVNELTDILGISQPYLYKLFRKRFNMSPKQYIISYKIHTAKKMLADTDMSITQIANSVGYADVLAFSRIFSLKEKMSPIKYRMQIRNAL